MKNLLFILIFLPLVGMSQVELIITDSASKIDSVIIRQSKNYKGFKTEPIEHRLSNGDIYLSGYKLIGILKDKDIKTSNNHGHVGSSNVDTLSASYFERSLAKADSAFWVKPQELFRVNPDSTKITFSGNKYINGFSAVDRLFDNNNYFVYPDRLIAGWNSKTTTDTIRVKSTLQPEYRLLRLGSL